MVARTAFAVGLALIGSLAQAAQRGGGDDDYTPPAPVRPGCVSALFSDGYALAPRPGEPRATPRTPPPFGDPTGDAWEMEEVACWSGVWLRRGKSRLFDAYWVHPTGERVRAVLELRRRGREVTMLRRHEDGQSCRYDGRISNDWRSVEGSYTCSWERTPMAWRARIVRMKESSPEIIRRSYE